MTAACWAATASCIECAIDKEDMDMKKYFHNQANNSFDKLRMNGTYWVPSMASLSILERSSLIKESQP